MLRALQLFLRFNIPYQRHSFSIPGENLVLMNIYINAFHIKGNKAVNNDVYVLII